MKFIIAILLYTISLTAMALPSPKDVDNAYNSGNYARAEQMLLAVLKERPSAKAHFRLAEVYMRQNRHKESLSELQIARALDPSLKFVRNINDFNRMLVREQNLANPPPVIQRQVVQQPPQPRQVPVQQPVVQQGPPQSAETQIAVMKAKAELQKTDNEARKAENRSTLMIWLSILGIVLAAILAIWYFNMQAEKNAERRRLKEESEEQERLAKEQLAMFLDLTSQLSDAELICKTASTEPAEKQDVLDAIDAKQSSLTQLIYDAKYGRTIGSMALYSIKTAVKSLVEAANDGKFPLRTASKSTPQPSSAPLSTGTTYSTPVSSGTTYTTPVRPASSGGSSPTVEQHHHTTVVNNSNSDLLTGVIIGEVLASASHHHDTYSTPVYKSPPPVYQEPAYEPQYIDDTPSFTSNASYTDDWDDDTKSNASSSSSWFDDADDSSSKSSSSSGWGDSDSSSSSSDSLSSDSSSSDTNSW